MMKAILGTLSGIALIAFSYLCIVLSMAVHTNSLHTAKLLMNLNDSIVKMNTTLDAVNAKKTGTLAQINDVMRDARLTIAHSDRLMTKQERSIDQWNGQITTTLNNMNAAVVSTTENENKITESAQATLSATTKAVAGLQPVEDSLTVEVQDLQAATTSINTLVSDPEIKETITHTDSVMSNVQDTTKDVSHAVHEYVYPGPWQKVWGFISGAGLDIGKFFLP